MIFLEDLDDEKFIWRLKVEVQTSINSYKTSNGSYSKQIVKEK